MTILNKRNRLNYNVPRHLVPTITLIAHSNGITPAYWLRKTLEKAVREYQQQQQHVG